MQTGKDLLLSPAERTDVNEADSNLRRRTCPASYCDGLTTAAEPPPRRTGSATAST
jgi:hypothetical protein